MNTELPVAARHPRFLLLDEPGTLPQPADLVKARPVLTARPCETAGEGYDSAVSPDGVRQEVLRLALEFRVDVKYWKKEVLSAAEQVDECCKAMPYILKTIEMLHVLGGRTVVEIGSMRQALNRECLAALASGIHAVRSPSCCTDGHSTYFWARAGFTTLIPWTWTRTVGTSWRLPTAISTSRFPRT